MSLITHRCTKCAHPDIWRMDKPGVTKATCDGCACKCTPGQPEVIPTFDQAGQRIERIVKPGDAVSPGVPTCNCKDCEALHEQLTAT